MITADTALTTTADVGNHPFSMQCSSIAYPTYVASVTYNTSVTVQFCSVSSLVLPAIADQAMNINETPLLLTFAAATLASNACNYLVTYTYTVNKSESFIAFDYQNLSFLFSPTQGIEVKSYLVTV